MCISPESLPTNSAHRLRQAATVGKSSVPTRSIRLAAGTESRTAAAADASPGPPKIATRALARVFREIGVDFGILGAEETSDGDSQRLAGERGLFEMLAEKNAKALRRYEFGEVVTADPHGYNAFLNEYPGLGISYPTRHYTEFLADRLDLMRGATRDKREDEDNGEASRKSEKDNGNANDEPPKSDS